jgi:hypothetical protein
MGNTPHKAKAALCGAKSRDGDPCRQPALENGRCHYHGGRSLRGIASPTFKDGRHSKYLPGRLLERYQEAIADEQLLNLRDEIALVDTRLGELLGRLHTRESAAFWTALKDAKRRILSNPTGEDLKATMASLLDTIDAGGAEYELWAEITPLLETRRKLVESERKRLVDMQQMITAEEAMTLVAGLLRAVKRNVQDVGSLNAIQTEFISLVGRANRGRINAGSED